MYTYIHTPNRQGESKGEKEGKKETRQKKKKTRISPLPDPFHLIHFITKVPKWI